jgi:hypothetical protein
MEIVNKRKKGQDADTTSGRERPPCPDMPQDVIKLLEYNEKRAANALESLLHQVDGSMSHVERQRRIEELRTRRLLPADIREQVYDSFARGNNTRQMLSVVTFLYDMHNTSVMGEKLPPINSIFSRVPFSTQ